MSRGIFALLIFMLASNLVLAQPEVPSEAGDGKLFSLSEAMKYAESNAPSVKVSRADLADAEARIKETRAIGLPKVNGSVGYQHFIEIPSQLLPDFITPSIYGVLFKEGVIQPRPLNTGGVTPVQFGQKNSLEGKVTAQGLIFDATFFIALRGAKLYKNLAVARYNQTAKETHISVAKAYLASLIARENLERIDRNLVNLNKLIADTEGLYKEGFVEKVSVDRLKLSANNLNTQQNSLKEVVELSMSLLKFQMGFPIDQQIGLSTTLGEALGDAKTMLLIDNDQFDVTTKKAYKTLQVADSLNEIDLKRIRAGYYPNLVGFGQFSRTLQRNNLFDNDEADWIPSSVVGVTLNVPIFDGLDKSAKRQRILARIDKAQVQKQQFIQASKLALVNAKTSIKNARNGIKMSEESIKIAEEIYRIAQIKFNEGVGSSIEVTQAQTELYQAQDQLTQAQYNLSTAYVEYLDALGQL